MYEVLQVKTAQVVTQVQTGYGLDWLELVPHFRLSSLGTHNTINSQLWQPQTMNSLRQHS